MALFTTYIKDFLPTNLKDSLKNFVPQRVTRYLRSNEVYVVSFPKCGRTWLKVMICEVIYKSFPKMEKYNDVSTEKLYAIHSKIPRIVFTHDDDPQFKSPAEILTDKSFYRYTKVIFLVRDPKDVIESWFYEYKNRIEESYKTPARQLNVSSLEKFPFEEKGSLKSIVKFYNVWVANSHVPKQFLLIRYEDLQNDTLKVFRSVLSFLKLGDSVSDSILREVVSNNAFEKLKKRELEGSISLGKINNEFGSSNGESEDNFLKVRKGKVGSYRNVFSQETISFMDNYIKRFLSSKFRY